MHKHCQSLPIKMVSPAEYLRDAFEQDLDPGCRTNPMLIRRINFSKRERSESISRFRLHLKAKPVIDLPPIILRKSEEISSFYTEQLNTSGDIAILCPDQSSLTKTGILQLEQIA